MAKMRFLALIALLVLAVTEAHHTPEHTLRSPRFVVGKVQLYDVEFNVTSGIPGLSSQVSKSAFKAELQVYAKTDKEHLLKVTKVYTSGSVTAVDTKYADVPMQRNRELEQKLSTPIKFTLENGEVASYTLSPRESLESKKIKKAILRSLEMHVPEVALQQLESSNLRRRIPVVYNVTKDASWGEHTSHYLITVSPDAEFPYNNMVYNISRSENFEGELYYKNKFHHNFRYQGCPSVCRMDWESNEYCAGCPAGYEPYQSPVKTYVQQEHHLVYEEGIMTPEIIKTVEVHTAKMYDQDMKVLFSHTLRKIGYTRTTLEEPSGQTTYTNLDEQEPEIDENEIKEKCENHNPTEILETVKTLLRDVAKIIVRGDLEDRMSTRVGEKIILLKRAFSKLKADELKQFAESEITRKGSLKTAREEEKVKRQIWMDILPLIGTPESVSFIVSYIRENIDTELFVWEAKEILEALPRNIHVPNENTLRELRTLLSLSKTRTNHILHSAAHTCLARVISILCNGTELELESGSWNSRRVQRSAWFASEPVTHRNLAQTARSSFFSPLECPVRLVTEIVQELVRKLATTQKEDELISYLETLSQTGVSDVLPVISEYAYGTAENLRRFSSNYVEFVKSAAIFSLHSIVDRHPDEVLEIVMPLFFNQTESPKIRTAAFGVLIRCQPPLVVLQHVASHTWSEKSNEVGSYVTSTMESIGNSTYPCMQLTTQRIKQVMPMLKRFDIGWQHSKNLMWSYFDDVRMFGVTGQGTYTPNNASIIPSAIYHALSYSTDSMTDSIVEGALNMQGITQEKIFQFIDEHILGIEPVDTIPESKENQIFEEARIVDRIPETLRFTLYKKMFYTSSFYYLDMNNVISQVDTLLDYLTTYLMKTSSDFSGNLVKVFLPSSLHTVTIAKSLPYPVEFHMEQPMVLALKVETRERNPSLSNFHFFVRPSVYLTKLLINQVKNVEDCKEVGAYHEHKLVVSYPMQGKFQIQGLLNITMLYKLPELPKKVLYYWTESGTYAGRKTLQTLPSSEDRESIRTLPYPFKNSTVVHVTGLPPFHVEAYTEEFGQEESPNNPWEVFHFAVKRIMNAGWRYRSVNITHENSRKWTQDTEAIFTIQYNRNNFAKGRKERMSRHHSAPWSRNVHKTNEWMAHSVGSWPENSPQEGFWKPDSELNWDSPKKWSANSEPQQDESLAADWWNSGRRTEVDDDWAEDLKPGDIQRNRNPSTFLNQAKHISNKLSTMLPHITHNVTIKIETRPVYSSGIVVVEFNHTHSRSLQTVHVEAAIEDEQHRISKQITFDHVIGFFKKPDEFQYDRYTDDQTAVFISAIRTRPTDCLCPWKDMEVVAKGIFSYQPLSTILDDELERPLGRELSLPEDHKQCVKDVRDGHSQSESCLKAIKERSIYNKLRMSVLWNQDVSERTKVFGRKLDTYLKYVYYPYMSVDYHRNTENKIHFALDHIDKFTERHLFDVLIEKPEETLTFRRLKTISLPLPSVHNVVEVDLLEFTNNTYPPTCVMMEKSVRTYDLKYYPLSLDRCSYILSTHCTDSKNFAIIAKILSEDGTKEIYVHIGTHTLIMYPLSGTHYTIKYDGQDYTVNEPLVFQDENSEIYVYSERFTSSHRHLTVVAGKAGIKVLYDGKNAKVKIDSRYKGQTCGLCSEFDGETLREYRGVDKCLYSHPDDFVNSAIVNRGTCRKQTSYPYICEDSNREPRTRGRSARYEPTLKRNIIISKGNEVCFSVHPVPVCDSDAQPAETETVQIGFHCLPKQDITVRRMINEAKRRSLGELENKSVDYEEEKEIAKMC